MLSSTITSVSGSSKIFNLGLVTYSNKSKISILKIPKKIISKYGSVSNECCLSMVKNLSKISRANISVSITGVAGPSGGSKLKPIGLVFIGIKKGNKIIIQRNLFKKKNRILIQKAVTIKVLSNVLALK
jgi:nicotinamide-nucleotide amidase